MTGLRIWLAFGLLCAVWGSSYLFIRVGVRDLSPIALVALRLAVGAVTISAIAAIRRHNLYLRRRELATLTVIATVNTTFPFLLISWGEVNVPSGLASVLNSTVPIFSVVLAAVVLKDEPLTRPRIAGVAVGFCGVVILMGRDLMSASINWPSVGSQAMIVLAAMCYAIGAVSIRRTLRGVAPLTLATYTMLICAAETTVLSVLFSQPAWTHMSARTWLAVGWLGILGSGLAYILAFYVLSRWGAGRYTLVAYMLPITGITLGWIFLHEAVDWHLILGSTLVVGGVALASLVRRPKPLQPDSVSRRSVTVHEQ